MLHTKSAPAEGGGRIARPSEITPPPIRRNVSVSRFRNPLWICLICCLFPLTLYGNVPKPDDPSIQNAASIPVDGDPQRDASSVWPYQRSEIKQQLEAMLSDWGETVVEVDAALVRHVCYFYKYYTFIDRRGTNQVLQRSRDYYPNIRTIFSEFKLPDELAFAVPFVESAFRNKARSDKKAVGMFQFLKGTARAFGLQVSGSIDERKDYRKSARACAAYLSENREKFESILLGIGSFHNGTTRLARVMRQLPVSDDGVDFVSIFNHRKLGKYSKEYIPKCLAASLFFRFLRDRDLTAIPEIETDQITLPRFAYVSDLKKKYPAVLTLNPDLEKAKTTYLYATTRGYHLVADISYPGATAPVPIPTPDTATEVVADASPEVTEPPDPAARHAKQSEAPEAPPKPESSLIASVEPSEPEPEPGDETNTVPRLVGMKWDESIRDKYESREIVMNESYTGAVSEIGVIYDQNLKSGDAWPEGEVLILEVGRPPIPEDELSPEEYYRFIQEYMKMLRKRG